MPVSGWRPDSAITGRGSGIVVEGELYHQVVTFRAAKMVRIEYFGEWSEALEAAGLEE